MDFLCLHLLEAHKGGRSPPPYRRLSVDLFDDGFAVVPFWLCEPCLKRAIGDPQEGTQAQAGPAFESAGEKLFESAGDLSGPLCAECAAGFRQ